MSLLDDINGTLMATVASAEKHDWSTIACTLSWATVMKLHTRATIAHLSGEATDRIALIIEYRAYAGLVYGMDTNDAMEHLDRVAQSRLYSSAHEMMFHVHLAQYQWHFGDTTYAYSYITKALSIALRVPRGRRDQAIIELIRCIFSVRGMLDQGDTDYKIPRRELRSIARRLWPSLRYGDSWDLRRLTYLWLALTHHTVGNKLRCSFYVGLAGKKGQWIDWDAATKRPVPYVTPTFPYASV